MLAGLEDCLKFLKNFSFSDCDVAYLRQVLPPETDPEFFEFLLHVDVQKLVLRWLP
jgi:nicotinate phosphoribosyltransferase